MQKQERSQRSPWSSVVKVLDVYGVVLTHVRRRCVYVCARPVRVSQDLCLCVSRVFLKGTPRISLQVLLVPSFDLPVSVHEADANVGSASARTRRTHSICIICSHGIGAFTHCR